MEKIPQNQTDVPVAETKAEVCPKLVWGPELGEMTWYEAREIARKVNLEDRKEEYGEYGWRLPDESDFYSVNKKGETGDFKNFAYWAFWDVDDFPIKGSESHAYTYYKLHDNVFQKGIDDKNRKLSVRLVRGGLFKG